MIEYKTIEQKSKFYHSGSWKQLRKQVLERDNNECQECKRNGLVMIDSYELNKRGTKKKIKLVVHHIKELEDHPELALDINNLETLCVDCHNKQHGRAFNYKPNKWRDDEKW